MQGRLHPSLRSYIDCFLSPPFPKQFPRGGGLYDQDPILMRDFREIRKFEVNWKNAERQREEARSKLGSRSPQMPSRGGGGLDLGSLLDELAEG